MRVDPAHGGVADYPPGAVFGPRRLGDWELVWILDGSARWSRGGRTLSLLPGQLMLIDPGEPDTFRWDERRTTRHAYIHFGLSGQAELGPMEGWPTVRTMTDQDPLRALCGYLLWLDRSPEPDAGVRRADVLGLLVRTFVRGPLPAEQAQQLPAPLEAAARHVAGQWATRLRAIDLDELALAAALSRRQLCRLSERELGVGPVKAFEVLRLSRVGVLLGRSNLTMQAIARACGYASQFHLSRRFHAEYGVPPAVYRRLAGTGGALPDPITDRGLQQLAWALDPGG